MKNLVYIVITVMMCGISFLAGSWWKQENLAVLPAFTLQDSIALQESPDAIGALPAGTTIYEYRAMGETITYIVFFNLENRMIIKSVVHEKMNTVAPLYGYVN